MYHYLESTKFIENTEQNQVVLSNSDKGTWIKIPKEWKNLLDQLIAYEKSYQEYLQLFESKEDCKKFDHMVQLLIEKEFITDSDTKSNVYIKKIYFAVTERCNLRCTHCCYDATVERDTTDLSTDEIIKILDKIIAAKPETIVLSGGEPLIRKDFIELLKYLRKYYRGEIILSTNGLLISSGNIDVLVENIDHFAISIDGYDESSVSSIRGKGVFDRVISNVKALKEKGAKDISLSMVKTEKEKDNIYLFKQLNEKLGTKPIVRALAPVGRGANLSDAETYMKSIYTEKKLSDKEAVYYADTCLTCKCGAVSKDLLINYDGNIYPCGLLLDEDYRLGNILNIESLSDLYRKLELEKGYQNFKNLLPENFEACRKCNVNLFCWHCLQELDMAKRHPEVVPIRCSIRKENLMKIVWGV